MGSRDGKEYYCYECRVGLDGLDTIRTGSVLGSSYQVQKFVKHTLQGSGSTHLLNSVFETTTVNRYRDWIINSAASGCLEIDEQGRHNYLYYAGREIGVTYSDGEFAWTDDCVKLVPPYDEDRIHSFPVSSTSFQEASFQSCSKPVPR